MENTWGHLYPKPGTKYPGKMLIAVGEYGDEMIVKSDFINLECSPQRHELEHSIFDKINFEPGVYQILCTLWFYKTCNETYLGKPIGKIISILQKKVL